MLWAVHVARMDENRNAYSVVLKARLAERLLAS